VEDIAVLVAASLGNGQGQTGLVTQEYQGEVTLDRFVQLDRRLQAVEAAVSQLCTLHEQTLQVVVQLYDAITAQKAKDIQSVTEVLRKAQQYVTQIHERKPTSEPEPSSCTCAPFIPSS
jgi:hypothetical protein